MILLILILLQLLSLLLMIMLTVAGNVVVDYDMPDDIGLLWLIMIYNHVLIAAKICE